MRIAHLMHKRDQLLHAGINSSAWVMTQETWEEMQQRAYGYSALILDYSWLQIHPGQASMYGLPVYPGATDGVIVNV